MKILYTKNKKNKKYLIKDTEKDYHSQYGLIKSEDIKKSNPGDILTSNINEKNATRILGKNKKRNIVVYCNTGQRARSAAEYFKSYGYENVFYIAGSYSSLE